MRRRSMLALALFALLPACGDDPLRPVDVAGSYELGSAAGSSLPAVIEESGPTATLVVAGDLILTEGVQFELRVEIEVRSQDPNDVPIRSVFQDEGGYELIDEEGIVLLSSVGQGTSSGVVDGSRILLDVELMPEAEEIRLEFNK